jgi:hypothetical protein
MGTPALLRQEKCLALVVKLASHPETRIFMQTTQTAQEEYQPLADYDMCAQHERWTRQQLEEYQVRTLQICRSYAYTHSPFYQKFHHGLMDLEQGHGHGAFRRTGDRP